MKRRQLPLRFAFFAEECPRCAHRSFDMTPHLLAWGIAALSTLGVIARPFGWPEFIWAVAGAVLLVVVGTLSPGEAAAAAGKGIDVYLFLIGMMLLAEIAREEGVLDYLAALAVRHSRQSAGRLFAIVYGVGTLVTIFLSNDATAVVLTPAVYAAATAAKVKPLPYLFVCAFIANAASFVLPISNPANLVIYGDHMPALPVWLAHFSLPALAAIASTFVILRIALHPALRETVAADVPEAPLGRGGKIVACGIGLTALVLLGASLVGLQLGLPTLLASLAVVGVTLALARQSPLTVLKGISWGVLPMVAGLFILVEGLGHTGVLAMLSQWLKAGATGALAETAWAAGLLVAFGSNLINNLPMGLIAASTSQAAQVPPQVTESLLIGVDIGPNLSVTGSLATILWLIALRREGISVSFWRFFKLGLLVMPASLLLALAALLLQPR